MPSCGSAPRSGMVPQVVKCSHPTTQGWLSTFEKADVFPMVISIMNVPRLSGFSISQTPFKAMFLWEGKPVSFYPNWSSSWVRNIGNLHEDLIPKILSRLPSHRICCRLLLSPSWGDSSPTVKSYNATCGWDLGFGARRSRSYLKFAATWAVTSPSVPSSPFWYQVFHVLSGADYLVSFFKHLLSRVLVYSVNNLSLPLLEWVTHASLY